VARSSRLAVALLGAGALPLAVACNDLIGISDYTRGECSGGGICSEAGALDGAAPIIEAGRDARVVVVEPSGTKPVRWAKFKMPNYPQDGGPVDNVATYARSADDAGVVDEVTGLTWREPMADTGIVSFDVARTTCAGLGSTWRLPSRIELVTLFDLTPGNPPTIDKKAFPSTKAGEYWTSSEVWTSDGVATGRHWTVDFANGVLGRLDVDSGTARVRCILGQQ
jgi:hypothetical protein